MKSKNIADSNTKRDNITLKVQPQELNLTDLKDLLKKSKFSEKKEIEKKNNIFSLIGYIFIILGIIILLISSLLVCFANREYFSLGNIIFIVGGSLVIVLIGIFILIKENI